MLTIRLRVFSRRKHREVTRKEKKYLPQSPKNTRGHKSHTWATFKDIRRRKLPDFFESFLYPALFSTFKLNALRTNNHSPPTFA
jgi:hypothetical protein